MQFVSLLTMVLRIGIQSDSYTCMLPGVNFFVSCMLLVRKACNHTAKELSCTVCLYIKDVLRVNEDINITDKYDSLDLCALTLNVRHFDTEAYLFFCSCPSCRCFIYKPRFY